MVDFNNPSHQAIVFGIAGAIAYVVGLWRRWRPGPSGRPALTETRMRVAREPWTIAAVILLLCAALIKFLARKGGV